MFWHPFLSGETGVKVSVRPHTIIPVQNTVRHERYILNGYTQVTENKELEKQERKEL